MPETRAQKEQRSRAAACRTLREQLDPRYTDAYVQKLENALWSDAKEESEKNKAAAAAAIAVDTTPPAVRDPLKFYTDTSTIKDRVLAAMKKIKPEDGDMTTAKPHGKRSSSQGRKNTSVHELDDSHNVISNHVLNHQLNHQLYLFLLDKGATLLVIALVLLAMFASDRATVEL